MNAIVDHSYFGIGAYSVPEASRLLGLSVGNVRRWLAGYKYSNRDGKIASIKKDQPPLWRLQHPKYDDRIMLGFKDLIELKIVNQFLKKDISLQTIRRSLEVARSIIDDSHPFTTRRFKTDGVSIFLQQIDEDGNQQTLDLRKRQYIIREVMEQSFVDLDLTNDLVSSWRPHKGKPSIVIDPARSFGQPIARDCGIPTVTLAQAAKVEKSMQAVVRLYEVPLGVVKDAVEFERKLAAA